MFVSHDREKLLNAIIYFVRETKRAHTLKLFKLLNFLDFEHFRQTGRIVTGLEYCAWQNGPAPRELWNELERGGDKDFHEAILLKIELDHITDEVLRRDLKPKKNFDSKYFSKRELKIMERLAFFFKETKGEDMSEFSHGQKQPWSKVWNNGKGKSELIPPDLAFEAEPLMPEIPNIDKAELALRKDMLREIA